MSEFKAEISMKGVCRAEACRGRRTEHTPSAGGRPRRSETTTLIASSAVSNSPGVAPVGRRVRTRVEGVAGSSCLLRSSPTTTNIAADALDMYSYTYHSFIDTHPYQSQHEMTDTPQLTPSPRHRENVISRRREEGCATSRYSKEHARTEHPNQYKDHSDTHRWANRQ